MTRRELWILTLGVVALVLLRTSAPVDAVTPMPWQSPQSTPALAVKPEAPKPEPLPELLATKIALIQSEYEKAGLILKATPAYQAWEAKTNDLGKQMDALLTPYQKEHACVIDQIAKTCAKPKDVK